ncbi:MAG: mandelate racemase/muconate lactonizing enzyme family protein, partial [Betaproteobacteria bacterium]|nr:mandelate racemase/muconate lactonizing enzyme family protein [Betaproteobacteria bacterium]
WSHFVTWRAGRIPHYQPEIKDQSGVRAMAKEAVERGFSAVKTNIWRYEQGGIAGWAPGFGNPFAPPLNVERKILNGLREHLQTIRDAAGPDLEVLLDLNFNAKTEGFLKILRAVADQDLFWVEIDSRDPDALAYIRAHSPHPIASCETLIGVQQFLPFLRRQAIDVAIIDTPWNGVWQSMKIAAVADAHEVNVACHNFYGHLCTMMNAHFCAAVPNLRIMEVDIDRIALDSALFTHEPEYQDGHLIMPDRPGWGTEPIEAVIHAHPPIKAHGLMGRSRTQT